MERRKASNELRAQAFAALSDPKRLYILEALIQQGEARADKIAQAVKEESATILPHLGALREAKLIIARRVGAYTYYRVVHAPSINKILTSVDEMLMRIEEMRRKGEI